MPEFILAVLVLELTPGPNMVYLAGLTFARGRSAGLLATAGVAAGLSVHAIGAALGLGVLIAELPLLYDVLRWTGVGYILYLAWESWRSGSREEIELTEKASLSLFWRGFFTNVFNPKSILFFVSVVPSFVRYESGDFGLLTQLARLGLTYVAVATAVHTSIVLLASRSRSRLIGLFRTGSIRRIFSLALVLVAFWLVWATRQT